MSFPRAAFILLVGLISFTFIFTRLYNIENRYLFEHDQEKAAEASWKIINEKKPVLIGQETSVGGLFVGPYLWWFQSVAMAIAGFNPLALVYLGILVSFGTLVLLFYIVQDISSKWQALFSAFIYTISPKLLSIDLSSHQLTYVMSLVLLIYWLTIKIIYENKKKFTPLLFFLVGLTLHVHFALMLFIPTVIILFVIYRPKLTFKQYLYSTILFSSSLLTYILFETRHDFIISSNLLKFLQEGSDLSFTNAINTINIYTNFLIGNIFINTSINLIIFLVLAVLFISSFTKIDLKFKIVTLITLIFPLFIFLFFTGHIPDYYFLPTAPIFIIFSGFVVFALKKYRIYVITALIALLISTNFSSLKKSLTTFLPFSYKLQIIDQVIKDSNGQVFNVYYQMPIGLDKGYRYLFKWRKNEPQENANYLYILEFNIKETFSASNYYFTYPNRNIKITHIGSVYIIGLK